MGEDDEVYILFLQSLLCHFRVADDLVDFFIVLDVDAEAFFHSDDFGGKEGADFLVILIVEVYFEDFSIRQDGVIVLTL